MRLSADVEVPFGMLKSELMELIMDIPDSATISVYTSEGDRPWESDSHELRFTWSK